MFKKFTKKIAIVTNVVLFLQLALFGILVNPTTVVAAVDEVAPILDNVSFEYSTSLDPTVRDLTFEGGIYKLELDKSATTNYLLQFSATTGVSEDLKDAYFPLYLDANAATVSKLEDYYTSMPEPFQTYLKDATNGLEPFAYIKGGPVGSFELLDAAKLDLLNIESDMTVPGDFPNGEYTVTGNISDPSDNETPVSFTIALQSAPVTVALSDDQSDSFVKNGDLVNISATFSEKVVNPTLDLGIQKVAMSKVTDTVWTYAWTVNELTDVKLAVNVEAVDSIGNPTLLPTGKTFYFVDNTAPVVNLSATPVSVNDSSKYTAVTFNADEEISLSSPAVVLSQKNNPITQLLLPELQKDSKSLTVVIPKDAFTGKEAIKVDATFSDIAGNKTSVTFEITSDVTAPLMITGLTTTVNADDSITVSWTNPNLTTDYDKVVVYRDGQAVYVLGKGVNVFGDYNTEKGKTYSYKIVLIDLAGNITETTEAIASVPSAKVAAVVADTFVPTAAEITQAPSEEPAVKAETTENEEKKEDAKKNGLPTWGLILLLVLAGVGGYLFLTDNKKEIKQPVRPVTKAKKVTSKKK